MELISRDHPRDGARPVVAIAAAVVVVLYAGVLFAADEAKPAAPPRPTLELKIDGPAKAKVDGSVTFEVVITNTGKIPARGLVDRSIASIRGWNTPRGRARSSGR